MNIVNVVWNTQKKTGEKIRKLNGGNLAPHISNEMAGQNIRSSFKELNLAFARLHDAPLTNPGCRLVDISQIFPLFHLDENDPRNYDFSYTDDYIGNCIGECTTPVFYRLGESIDHSIRKYKINPPADVRKWVNICSNIIRHYNEGLWDGYHHNIEWWEIWNEPECGGNTRIDPNAKNLMWLGTLDEYNAFYVQAATELKKRFPHLKFGGPAHCSFCEGRTDVFIRYCAEHHAPLDFYSYHCYTDDPYGWIQQTPGMVRKLLDENGYPDAEIHLNEWHYLPGGEWHRLRTDPDFKQHMYNDEMKGLDSAAFLCTTMMLWQDTPLTYGGYYYCCSGGWGCYKNLSNGLTPSWYGLKAYGDIVRYPERTEARSDTKDVAVLAGADGQGAGELLISAFRTGEVDFVLTADVPLKAENCRIQLLDNEHRLTAPDKMEFDGNTVRFSSFSNSAVALVRIS